MTISNSKLYAILSNHVPENAIHYCYDLWQKTPFHFRLANDRKTKLGDFKVNLKTDDFTISVNKSLHPYLFLITYVHEVAHLRTYLSYGKKVSPHGQRWQESFSATIKPLISDLIFPTSLIPLLEKHFEKPKATFYADVRLSKALLHYQNPSKGIKVDELNPGDEFLWNGQKYEFLKRRRTRALCKSNDKLYTLPLMLNIEIA